MFTCSIRNRKILLAALPLLLCASVVKADVTLNANTSPTSAYAGGQTINLTGSGFPAGTISASAVQVTITPPGGSGLSAVTVNAIGVAPPTSASVGNRTVGFKLPASMTTPASISNCKVTISGQTTTAVTFTSGVTSSNLTIVPAPTLKSISPAAGQRGTAVSVAIVGNFTHFNNSVPTVSAGAGITVSNVVVPPGDATHLTATFTIDPAATAGTRTVTVTNGTEVASLSNGFLVAVNPSVSVVTNPTFAQQGATNLDINLTGSGTTFTQGTTQAFFGDGIVTNSVTVTNATTAVANITVDPVAPVGNRTVTVVTGGEFAIVNPGLQVTTSGATLSSVSPNAGAQASNATVTITGTGTHFVQDATTVSFGSGINIGSITVASATSLTVNISVGPGAATGQRTVSVTTGGETVFKSNAFNVTAATPFLSGVSPTSGAQGQTLNVVFTGSFTNFLAGSLQANFGSNITVNSVTANNATQATANITIADTAIAGGRTCTLSSNGTNFNFTFTVTASSASLTSVSPSSGLQQSSVKLVVTGSNTHWAQGLTAASLDPTYITINRVVVNSPTSAEVNITIAANAPLGARTVTMSTGGEVVSAANAFTVLPFTPTMSIDPGSGMIGNTVNVTFNGSFTHWASGGTPTTVNISGQGISIQNFQVNSPVNATAKFIIDPTAPTAPSLACSPGNRTVTLTTGNEILTAPFCVTSTPAVLTSISPYHSPKPNGPFTVTISGAFTHFVQGTTTVGFGPDVTVSNVQVQSATQLTAQVAISANAALGYRQAFVNTGAEQLTIGFHIDSPASATLVSVVPNSGLQGQTLSNVTITGDLTNFLNGATQAILGLGVTVNSLTVVNSTTAVANISISPTTPPGARAVTMITGTEVVSGTLFSVGQGVSTISGIKINGGAIDSACSSPGVTATISQGEIKNFCITGINTHWLQGGTTLNLGGDISVDQLTVVNATTLNGRLTVKFSATPGFRGISATTDGETATSSSNAVNVQVSNATSVNITPTSGQQGTNFTIQINGIGTHFDSATPANTSVTFGNNTGVNVTSKTIASATQMNIGVTITGTADLGYRNLTITTENLPAGLSFPNNIEQITLPLAFYVNPGAAIITNVTPNSGFQGGTLNLTVTGQATHFQTGVTTAYMSSGGCTPATVAGVNVSNVTATDATHATVAIAVDPNAPTGFRTLCMYTGGETASFGNAFQVLPGTPTLNGVTPVQGLQGQSLTNVTLLGQFTHWQQGVTTVSFGQGITVSNIVVTDSEHLKVNLTIDPLAYAGPRDVTVSTTVGQGLETLTRSLFVVAPGPAILSSITPSTANQGQHLLMQIIGQNTHWAQGLSQFHISGGGGDITVNGFIVQSPTTALADLTLGATAGLGVRTVFISTAGENVTLQDGFVVTGGIPSVTSISPYSIQQGQSNVNVQIGGAFTHWTNLTTVDFGGLDITVQSVTRNSDTSLTAVINVANGAALGLRTVTVQTGGQALTSQVNILSNAPPTPYISYTSPGVALRGQTLTVYLGGAYTHWIPGTSSITFGGGITLNSFQVTGLTSAAANITISNAATLGSRTVTITTGSEVVTTQFTVTVGTPAITFVDPPTLIQGQQRQINIVGQYTTWTPATVFNLGQGITVNSKTILGATTAQLDVTVDILANLGGRSVTATTGAEVAYGYATVTQSQATITLVAPNTGKQNDTMTVRIAGFATHWAQGQTNFTFGSGIQLTAVNILSQTTASVDIAIDPLAYVGFRDVTATTLGEVATLHNAFVVQPGTPILLSSTPCCAQQGANFSIGVLGQFTNFVNGTTTASLGNGVTVTGVNVTGPQSVTITGTVNPVAFTGGRNISVITGNQTLTLYGAFYVQPGPAVVSQLTPNSGNQGQTLDVAITGTQTHFSQGNTAANFGAGVSVNTLTVNSATSATANVTVAANATPQQNSVTLTTLGESATISSAFTIVAATPDCITSLPNSGAQGSTFDVTVACVFTHFVQGTTTASFGTGVTINGVTVNSNTTATVNVTIQPTANTGQRTLTMTTNSEVATKQNALNVTAGPATISTVSANSGRQNDTNLQVTVTGSSTHFTNGTTVDFGSGITVALVQVSNATSLVATINIAQNASLGNRTVTVTTGGEIATKVNGFSVSAGLPVVTGVSANSGHQNETLTVTVTGLYTNFVNGTTAADFGAGITINTVTVTDATHANVNLTVQAGAATGARTVVMTTGGETAQQVGAFTVTAGLPQLISVVPNTGAQASTQTVTITGLFTHFVQGTSTVQIAGGGLTLGTVTVHSPTELELPVTVQAGASASARTVTVFTGAESASLSNAFTVLPGSPAITQITPNIGVPSTPSLSVTIYGQFTNFVNGTTQVSFGPGIGVNGGALGAFHTVVVSNATTLTATLNIDAAAALGSRDVTVQTGAEVITVNQGFTVQSNSPTPPVVIHTSPTPNATAVPTNTSATFLFSAPVDATTVTPTSVYLSSGGCGGARNVTANVSIDPGGRSVTITPVGVLEVGKTYTMQFNVSSLPYVQDPAAHNLNGACYNFTTGFASDNTGPTYLDSNILAGAADVGTNAPVILGFDKEINPATQPAGIQVKQGAVNVPGFWSYSNDHKQASFTATGGFTPATTYTVVTTAALKDPVGNALTNPGSFSFTTAAGADNTSPTLLRWTPENGATPGTNTAFVMEFDKRIDPLSVTPATFYVVNTNTNPNYTAMNTTFVISADRKTVRMVLPAPLDASTPYYWTSGVFYDETHHSWCCVTQSFSTGPAADNTPPTVTQVSPPDGQGTIPANAKISVRLSEPIATPSVSPGVIQLTPSVPGTVAASADRRTVTFTPSGNLSNGLYTVNASGLKDLSGNDMTAFTSSFTVGAAADTSNGTIFPAPANGATDVATNTTNIVISFNKRVNPITVTSTSFRLYDQTVNAYLAGSIVVNANFMSATFTPTSWLPALHTICTQAGISASITDLAGNNFNAINACFTTGTLVDVTAPTVLSVSPVNNATGIGPANPVTVTFSKSMNPSILSNSSAALYRGSDLVSNSFGRSADNTSITFSNGALAYSTTYTVVVHPDVADLIGNKLGTEFRSSFTTIPQPVIARPEVSGVRPAPGATGVPLNTQITFFVSAPLANGTLAGSIKVAQNGVLINGSINQLPDGRTIVFTPAGPLQPGSVIGVWFQSTATDAGGNKLIDYQSSFQTVPNTVGVAPTLSSTSPCQSCSTNIPVNSVVDVQFSQPIDMATVTNASFYVMRLNSSSVAGTVGPVPGNPSAIRFTPSSNLNQGDYYYVYLTNAIQGTNGVAFAGTNYYFYASVAADNTPLTVSAVAPTNASTNIGNNALIRVTFSKPIDPLTVTGSSIQVSSGGAIPTSFSFDSTNTVVTVTPQAPLPLSSAVTVSVTNQVTDPTNHAAAAFSATFNTGASPDYGVPSVVSSNVQNGQANVPVPTAILLNFNKPIDTRTVDYGNYVYLSDNVLGGTVPATLTFSPDGMQVGIQPNSFLAVNRNYSLTAYNVRDLNGNTMPCCYSVNFTTALAAPVGGPQVTDLVPGAGMTGIPVNFKPMAQFDRPVAVTSLGSITFTLNGNPVGFTTSLSNGNTTLTIVPNALLQASTAPNAYVLTIQGVKDAAGTAMGAPVSRAFSTGPSFDIVAPSVTTYTPINNSSTGTHPVIRFRFNERINSIRSSGWYLYNNVTGRYFPGATLTFAADLLSATITYPGNLDPNTSYQANSGTNYDLAGNIVGGTGLNFTTGSGVDNTAPTITASTPPNGATVPSNAVVRLRFSEPIDPTTITSSSLTVSGATGTPQLSSDGQTLDFVADAVYSSGGHTVNASGFADLSGNGIAPFSSSFTSSGLVDTGSGGSQGTISLTTPAPGSTVEPTTTITVTLNKPVNPIYLLNPLTFEVCIANDCGSNRVAGTVVLNPNNTITFTPTSQLPPSSSISVYVGYFAALYDLSDHAFQTLYNAQFNTTNTPDNTAPTVTMTPAPGSSNIGPNAVVTLTFSKSLNASTVNAANFALYNGASNLGATITRSGDNRTVNFSAQLPYGATITVVVGTNVTDMNGNHLAAPFINTFTTAPQPFTSNANVIQLRPTAGAQNVPVNSTVTFYFDHPMNPSTINGALYLSQNGVLVPGTAVTNPVDARSVVFTPTSPFQPNAYIQVFFTSSALDVNGNPLNAYNTSFRTAADNSSAAPTLVAVSPSKYTSGNPRNSVFDVKFDKPMNAATVTAANFYLRSSSNATVSGAIAQVGSNGTTWRFTPSAPTASGDYVYVYLTSGLQDTGGHAFAGDNWYVYAGSTSDNAAPTISAVNPATGSTGVGDNGIVRVVFNGAIAATTVNTGSVALLNGATPIPYNVAFGTASDNVSTILTLTPQAPLPDNTTITLNLSSASPANQITDSAGNVVAAQTVTFQTGAGADFTQPQVLYSSVANGASSVPVNSTFTFQFSKPMDPSSISAVNNYFYVYDNYVGYVPVNVSVSPDGRSVTLIPQSNLTANHSFSTGAYYATDLTGNPQINFGVSFDTFGSSTDSTPPSLISSNPANTATNVPINAVIEIGFNEAVSGTSLGGIQLLAGATPVPFTATLSYGNQVVRLTPSSLLATSTTYTVNIVGVQDLAGNTVSSTSRTFTTGFNPLLAGPQIVGALAGAAPMTNGTNINGVAVNSSFTFTFNSPIDIHTAMNGAIRFTNPSNSGQPIPSTFAISADQKTITVTPLSPLSNGTQYQFWVNYFVNIRDTAGNTETDGGKTFPFTTVP